jgi:hypothetical protein
MLLIYFGMTGEIDRLHIQNWRGDVLQLTEL